MADANAGDMIYQLLLLQSSRDLPVFVDVPVVDAKPMSFALAPRGTVAWYAIRRHVEQANAGEVSNIAIVASQLCVCPAMNC